MNDKDKDRIKVFLVDDHPIVREGVRSYLANQGAIEVVGEASDGHEALRKVKRLSPDVIVLDVSLPSIDGGELTRRFRRIVHEAKILAFSIHAGKEYVVRMARCGVHGYLTKDGPTAQLLAAIKHVSQGGLFFPADMTDAILAPGARSPSPQPGVAALSGRERDVLILIAEGLTNKEIARKLGISVRTAEAHRERLARKLDIRTVAGLTKYAIQQGLTSIA